MNRKSLLFVCLGVFMIAFTAWADPSVVFSPATNDDQNNTPSGSAQIEYDVVNDWWTVTATCTFFDGLGPLKITIRAGTPDRMKLVRIAGFSHREVAVTILGHGTARCGPIDAIQTILSAQTDLSGLYMIGTLGDPAFPDTDVISGFSHASNLDIEGDVYGHIPTNGSGQNTICKIYGDLHGDLIAAQGYHRDIQILSLGGSGGNLYGDIIAENGWISSLIVDESIGSPGSPVNIWSRASLDYLECQDLYANIDTTLYGLSAAIYELRVESADPARGNFEGTIRCGYVTKDDGPDTGAFIITGDSLGEIYIDRTFREDLSIGTLSAIEPLSIGHRLHENCLVQFNDPLGLEGQMIINAKNLTYTWDGTVEYIKDSAFVALAPTPYYNNNSIDFGGGAVGLVPYYLHYADCQPSGTKVDEGTDGHENGLGECEEGYHALKKVHPAWSLPKVTLRHYGPILQAGTGKPFTVKRKTIYTLACDAGGNPNWADVTANFTHSFPAGEDRAIEINGSFAPGYDYLIEPKVDSNGADYLYCGGLDSSVGMVPIKDYDYRLRVIVAPDITGNGLLQADDITAWVLDPQDANLDGTTDNNDLVDVINAVAESGE